MKACPFCGEPADSSMTPWGLEMIACVCVPRDRCYIMPTDLNVLVAMIRPEQVGVIKLDILAEIERAVRNAGGGHGESC